MTIKIMSTFYIKNMSSVALTVFGTSFDPNKKVDLLSVATAPQIIASMRSGDLYSLLIGRMVSVPSPIEFSNLAPTQDDMDYFYRCGFVQGHLDSDDLKYPFKFTGDGYVFANVVGFTVPPLSVDIHGDSPVPTDRDSILAMGTEDGTIAGTVHVLKIGTDGKVQVIDTIMDGYLFLADGYLATLAGTVDSGKIKVISSTADTLAGIADGYLHTLADTVDSGKVKVISSTADILAGIADGYLNTLSDTVDAGKVKVISSTADTLVGIADGYLHTLADTVDAGKVKVISSTADTLVGIADGYLNTLSDTVDSGKVKVISSTADTLVGIADGYLNTLSDTVDAGKVKVISSTADTLVGIADGYLHTLADTVDAGKVKVISSTADGYLSTIAGAIKAEDTAHVIGDVGIIALQVRRDVAVSSAGSDGDLVTPNQDADGHMYTRDKAYDSATNAERVECVNPILTYRTGPVAIIVAAQTVTNSWADLGPEIPTDGQTELRGWFKYTKGDGYINTLQVRALAKHTSAGAEEYPLYITKTDTTSSPYSETLDDEAIYLSPVEASGLRTVLWELGNTTPYVQLQIKATTPGTTMTINTAFYTSGWK